MRWVLTVLLLAFVAPAFAEEGGVAFPLTALWGPPCAEKEFAAYRDSGFNLIQIPAGAEAEKASKLAASMGLGVLIVNPQAVYPNPEEWREKAGAFTNVAGWIVDTPITPEATSSLIGALKTLWNGKESRVFAPILPCSDEEGWAQTIAGLSQAGLRTICWRRDWLRADGANDEDGFYQDLERYRRLAMQLNIPFWGFVQVSAHGEWRSASDSDIRLQVYSHLAYGARGLCYHTYWGPKKAERVGAYAEWGYCMVDPDLGIRLYPGEKVAAVNREVMAWAPILRQLTSQGVYFVGAIPKGCAGLPEKGLLVQRIEAPRALAGFFKDEAGRTWVLVVNRTYGKQRSSTTTASTVRLALATTVARAIELDRAGAGERELVIDGGIASVTVPGGTGALVRLEEGATAPR